MCLKGLHSADRNTEIFLDVNGSIQNLHWCNRNQHYFDYILWLLCFVGIQDINILSVQFKLYMVCTQLTKRKQY